MTDTTEFHRRRKLLADYLRGIPEIHYCHDTFAVVFPSGWLDEQYGEVLDSVKTHGNSFGNAIDNLCDTQGGDPIFEATTPASMLSRPATVCGTAACASGWAAFGVANNGLAIPREVAADEYRLAEWLGYSGCDQDSPFWEKAYNKPLSDVTKADVIAYLERGI